MAFATRGGVEIEGLEAFQRAVSRTKDREFVKAMQQVHKHIGEFVIVRLQPPPQPSAIGEGRGTKVRTSGSRYSVQLKVGGKHRAEHAPKPQWGVRRTGGFGHRPARPYIMGTVQRHSEAIERAYLEAVVRAFRNTFYKVRVG